MQKLRNILLFLPAMVIISLAFCFKKNKTNSDTIISQSVLEVLENSHYEPRLIDDKFSEELFNLYLKKIDNSKRFFLASDIDSLKQYKKQLDDQAKANEYQYFDMANRIHVRRINQIAVWYKEILNKPFNFNQKETFEFDEENPQYLKTDAELKEFWRKSIKQQVLEKLFQKTKVQDKAKEKKDTIIKILPYDTLEMQARKEVLKTHNDWFTRLQKFDKKEKISLYINCITELFDPHSNYFPPKDKENFDIRMSGKLEGIGAQLQEKDGYLKVASIVPGSASYKQGELKAGDIILKVAQGAAEPVDVTNMKIDDAIQLIRGKKGSEVRLTVKKLDESIKIIPIIREVVVLEEGFAKSSIIEKDGEKYGYINLPTFYRDFDDPRNGKSCARDVATEVQKLKADGVKGIILDLRNNGGGSLNDVVDMGGLFIEKGPITLIKDRSKRVEILADDDRSVLYDGPLTIMVNENSASASEILAAAMQDYGRAAIIGTTTFGKGTVQRFFELDAMFRHESGELGAVKATIQKFYRINGGTTQLAGVTPDIIIPDRYRYIEYGEKDSEHPLGVDKIEKANYSTMINYSAAIANAKRNSDKRIAQSQIFKEIERLALKIKAQSKRTKFTLNLEEYKAEQKQLEEDNKLYEESIKQIKALTFSTPNTDLNELNNDNIKIKMRNDWNKGFEKDIYIQEAVEVLKDMKK